MQYKKVVVNLLFCEGGSKDIGVNRVHSTSKVTIETTITVVTIFKSQPMNSFNIIVNLVNIRVMHKKCY